MKKIILLKCLLITLIAQAQNVTIPDANFKAALLAHSTKIDTNDDGEIQITEAEVVTILSVGLSNISDLTGIEAFTNLTTLRANNNNLTSVNLSQNTKLEVLVLSYNKLTALNLFYNTKLTLIALQSNELTFLNVSNLSELTSLDCSINKLTSINTAFATSLTNLQLWQNQLTGLNISNNKALITLYIGDNKLTSLDITPNTSIVNLSVFKNNFTALNLKNGKNDQFPSNFSVDQNPNLNCVEVDNKVYSDANWGKDAHTMFSENCATASVEDLKLTDFSIYPNPSTHIINIKTLNKIKEAVIYSILGDKVLHTNTQNIDISKLNRGIYLIKVTTTDDKVGVKRFVKK